MPYSFLNDLKDIKDFYEDGGIQPGNLLPRQTARLLMANDPSLHSSVTKLVNQRTASFNFLLRKMVPVMLCTAWEGFAAELGINDNARYLAHFTPMTKWHNEPIREIALIRHCIVHNNGKIDQEYLNVSRIKTFTLLNFQIDFTDIELDTQFKTFEDAYKNIMA